MRVRSGAALFLLLLLGGCSISPLAKRAATFSTAATAATAKMQNAYQLVEQSYTQVQMANLVNDYDRDEFRQDQIQPFMPGAAMQARTRMLAGLEQYANVLAEVSSNKPVAALDAQSEALGKSLQGLSDSTGLTQVAQNANVDLSLASSAVDLLGRMLIAHEQAKELPAILTRMQKPVDTICQLLEADIGTAKGFGLRSELHSNFSTLIGDQRLYIKANEAKMSPAEKRSEIEKLPQLVLAEKQDDTMLQQTQAALEALAKANDALLAAKGSKQAPAFHQRLLQLIAAGQQIGTVYKATVT